VNSMRETKTMSKSEFNERKKEKQKSKFNERKKEKQKL